ncbi:MAG: PD-(D/E)XK nuclease family protein, partial [Nitrospirota bacterium]|nr:PD-(D/E)XK nuclease family protein [Nitrospirota bacterium]
RHNLLQMHSQIEVIRTNDIVKTRRELADLKKKLIQIRKKEYYYIKDRLYNLVLALSLIREREHDEIRKRLHSLTYNLSLIKKKEFSFMKVFGLENNELVHSCVLAWLLDPLESHNLGSLFVERFLQETGLKVDEFDFSKFYVEREISSDKSRLDIRIFDSYGKFQCVIENKIWSNEGADQTKRLYSDFHDKSYEKELFLFLALNQRQPNDKHFTRMDYEQILQILTELLDLSTGDTRFLIKHYVNTLERLIMSEKFEGFSERTRLYYQYYKDTAELKKAFENDRRLLLNTLEAAIRESDWWDENSWEMEKRGGDIWIWKNSWVLSKNEGIKFQLYMYITELGFAIRIYGVQSEFAAEVKSVIERYVNEKYPEEIPGGLRKAFGTGVSKFLEKAIRFSPTEKTQIEKILKNLNNMIELFDDIIIKSISELKQKK